MSEWDSGFGQKLFVDWICIEYSELYRHQFWKKPMKDMHHY